LHILNGIAPGDPAPYTCTKHAGASCVDYILCGDASLNIQYDKAVLGNLSDHVLMTVCLPMPQVRDMLNPTCEARVTRVSYKWDEGTCVANYADAATRWQEYTT
jgi:hypothetical protein